METKICKIDPRELKLLEKNARYMKQEEYQQLVKNIKRDGVLSSVPFCVREEDWETGEVTFEVLSGNHRVMAAIDAGLKEIEIMYTEEELTRSQKIGIILSHNSISGKDDLAILKELYEEIDDLDYKEYSGLDDDTLKLLDKVGTQSISALGLQYQIMNVVVLPTELNEAMKVIDKVKSEVKKNTALTMRYSEYDKWLDTIDDVGSAIGVKNTATVILAILGLVENHLEELKDIWVEEAEDKQWVPLSTIFTRTKVMAKDGRIINKAVDKMISRGEIKKSEKHKAIVKLAEMYLESEKANKKK